MAASTAIEECENTFPPPCSQVGCLHEDSTISTQKDERDQGSTGVSIPNPTRAYLPDPTLIFKLGPKRGAGTKLPGNSSGGPVDDPESDHHVLMRCYHPGADDDFKYKVVVSETPVSIAHLPLVEQNIAYENVLVNARPEKIQEHYTLHLSRLEAIREAIVACEDEMAAFLESRIRYHVHKERVHNGVVAHEPAIDEGGGDHGGDDDEGQIRRALEGYHAYRKVERERNKLRACERGVMMLLVRCESVGEGQEGFERVKWQASSGKDKGSWARA